MQTTTTSGQPSAFISSGRNRLKIYGGNNIYLKDKTSFEIELYNPLSETIAAKIYINGKSISNSMIVLKPGERSYLERFLDTPKKFLFETYVIEDSKDSKEAIKNNGSVRIEFYKEKSVNPFIWTTGTGPYYPQGWGGTITWPGTFTVGHTGFTGTSGSIGLTGFCDANSITSNCTTASLGNATRDFASIEDTKSIETGRIEKGSSSNQDFNNYYGDFESYYFASVEYKILPESQKPVELNSIRQYCSECGIRVRKSSWKYCCNCGNKLK